MISVKKKILMSSLEWNESLLKCNQLQQGISLLLKKKIVSYFAGGGLRVRHYAGSRELKRT